MDIEKEKQQRQLYLGIVLNPDIKVRRYMDLPKFLSLLEKQSLFFRRADLFADKFEGSFTKSSVEYRKKVWREAMANIPQEQFDSFLRSHSHRNKDERKDYYINCWHMNEHESAAMWELYGIKNQTIAIQSRYGILLSHFHFEL